MVEKVWRALDARQADELACVMCGRSSLEALGGVSRGFIPVGRSVTGSQVFACENRCTELVELSSDPADEDR